MLVNHLHDPIDFMLTDTKLLTLARRQAAIIQPKFQAYAVDHDMYMGRFRSLQVNDRSTRDAIKHPQLADAQSPRQSVLPVPAHRERLTPAR